MTIHATINTYQQKHALYPPLIPPPPPADLGLVVVIPCCNEPDVFATLHALWSCSRPACSTEIILVINHAATSPDLVRSHNLATKQAADAWVTAHHDPKLCIHPLFFPDLPDRHAGVGLARKIGMDEAAHRLASVGNNHGVIACIDADCDCSPNYLTTLHDHFRDDKKTPGCVIHFEHRYGNLTDPSLRDAIVQYELYLRYHVRGLDCAGSPYAFHTVGSCMAVRASVYMRQGGIKPRKGGEDFYFIQKMIGLGNLTKIRTATVY
ncbi:MAG TPA: hypothetical protein HPQ00_14925, partial [Magnetococcales bacterium]|nr:hypothetical protein [Magnetococcales bacterium]